MKQSTKSIGIFMVFFLSIIIFPIIVSAQSTIDIGLITPLTGPGAMVGRDTRDGALFLFDKVNTSGGINGRKINCIVMDDKNVPTNTLNAAKKLIYQDKVFALWTGYSPSALAVMPLTQETETIQIVGGVAKKIVESGHKWIIRSTPSDSLLAAHYVTFAVKKLNLKKLAILNESTDYGKGGAEDVINNITKYNMKPLLVESYNQGDKDFASQLNKIKNAGADGLFIWGLYVEGAQIIRQAKQLGLSIPILASSGVFQAAFLELAGKDAEGLYMETYFYLDNPAPHVQAFIKEFRTKFNYDPTAGSGIIYDGMTILLNAIKKVGVDKYKVIKEMRSSKFDGILGKMECDDTGQCGRGALVVQVKDGKPVVVWSPD
jgi:branched-chain amino acid transport system substrate-binding protein